MELAWIKDRDNNWVLKHRNHHINIIKTPGHTFVAIIQTPEGRYISTTTPSLDAAKQWCEERLAKLL